MRPTGVLAAVIAGFVLSTSAAGAASLNLQGSPTKAAAAAPLAPVATGWTTYHHDNSRNGYDPNAPAFTGGPFSNWNKAVDQPVYAQPLALSGRVYVATMGDSIYAIDVATGNQVWARTALGTPSTATFCSFHPGDIGIMSTPVIDPASGIIYAAGLTTAPSVKYQLYALNISDGTTVAGFPVDLSVDPTYQNQRAALALGNGHVYAAFGGWAGDCGTYHPQVVSVPIAGGAQDHAYQPQTTCQNGASIWGPSGIAIDGAGSLYVATGNGNGCYGSSGFPCTNGSWDRGDGVIKLSATLAETSFWAPDNATQSWCSLHSSDSDIGSLGPALLPNNEIFQTGKSGYGWLLNSAALGGFDAQQSQASACGGSVFGGIAYYAGRVYLPCDGVGLVALSVNTTTHTITTPADWIQSVSPGPPIAAMGLIWTRNQAGTTLYGFDPATGAQRVSAPLGGGSNHFGTLSEDGGWIFVPHGANIRAFNFNPPPCSSTTSTHWVASCSVQQYSLTGSNGSTWADMDATNLSVTFTPAANSWAVISGNVDLWTSSPGYNQDVGIALSGGIYPSTAGQPEVWKESGGAAGFSPNAAFVQRVIPVIAATAYTAKLQWKANRSDPGTIWAGAGPIPGGFSPTRISVMLLPTSAGTAFTAASTAQYHLTGSDGTTWQDVDGTNLSLSFTPPTGSWLAFISGNADLWTANAGYNQDLGVSLSGPGYPTVAGQPEGWKESGGGAGTFSPNAAFVQTPLVVAGGTAYSAKLQWKANKSDPGSIYAGAGPIGVKFSPTSLNVVLIPNPAGAVVRSSTLQYGLANSNGTTWQAMSGTALQLTLAPGVSSNYLLSANADLWTAVAGYNQDIGIMVSGGTFGTGTLVTWKESGGLMGAFSPNAAFAFGDVPLVGGTTYTVWLVWKANRAAQGSTSIYAGAGPVNGTFSPTSLTATLLN
jgi:outer membrane protein assembly factor BamB